MSPGVLFVVFAVGAGVTSDTVDRAAKALDRAAACRRRAKVECMVTQSERALDLLGDAEGPPPLLKEALVIHAEGLALADRAEDAERAFGELYRAFPRWRVPPDADEKVRQAAERAWTAVIAASLPETIGAGPAPALPLPTPDALAPPPVLFAPARIRNIDPERVGLRPWRLSIAGGAAFLGPESSDRFDTGAAAAVDLLVYLHSQWAIWVQALMTLHSFDSALPVEPGYGRGLTTAFFAVGTMFTQPLVDRLQLNAGVGVGASLYGIRRAGEEQAFGVQGALGLRYAVSDSLAVRLEAVPSLAIPVDGRTPGGHVTALARAEIRF